MPINFWNDHKENIWVTWARRQLNYERYIRGAFDDLKFVKGKIAEKKSGWCQGELWTCILGSMDWVNRQGIGPLIHNVKVKSGKGLDLFRKDGGKNKVG